MTDGMRGRGKRKGCSKGRTTASWERETKGRWDWVDDGTWQRGTGQRGVATKSQLGKMADRKRQATAAWDWETSRHGVVKQGLTMQILTTGGREDALNSGTALRCPQG